MKKPSMLRRLERSQKGFTLLELIIVIALTGIIAAAAAMSIHQVLTGTTLSNDTNTAINQVRNAGHWISRDVLMAQTVSPDNSDLTKFLTLTWPDPEDDTKQHKVIYKLDSYGSSGLTELVREHYYPDDDLLEATTFIATNIVPPCNEPPDDPAYHDTWCDPYENRVLKMNITACNDRDYEMRTEYPEDYDGGKEKRAFQAKSRPD